MNAIFYGGKSWSRDGRPVGLSSSVVAQDPGTRRDATEKNCPPFSEEFGPFLSGRLSAIIHERPNLVSIVSFQVRIDVTLVAGGHCGAYLRDAAHNGPPLIYAHEQQ